LVALRGDRHAARVSASLLTAAGHGEWIAEDEDGYVRIATELASDPAKLAALRIGLREDMRKSQLMDHASYAAHFSSALRTCWSTWCAKQASSLRG
jgi:predicted O-linked N-acetylglucosamine transferase (SPINDLY family)